MLKVSFLTYGSSQAIFGLTRLFSALMSRDFMRVSPDYMTDNASWTGTQRLLYNMAPRLLICIRTCIRIHTDTP